MKTYLLIYPHCYSRCYGQCLFIYNPINKEYACFNDINDNIFNQSRVIELDINNELLMDFTNQCVSKGLGYIYETMSDILPINRVYKLRFISSTSKLKLALGYNNGASILNFITSITLYTTNNNLLFEDKKIYAQLNYPEYGSKLLYSISDVFKYIYPNLQDITITGDINEHFISEVVERHPYCSITIKTLLSFENIEKIKKLVHEYRNMNFSIIITSKEDYLTLKRNLYDHQESINVLYPIISPNQIKILGHSDFSISYIPLLFDIEKQKDIIDEMLLSISDILNCNTTLDEIYQKEVFDLNLFGSICIFSNGNIMAFTDYIGNVLQDRTLDNITNWINKENNIWKQSRTKSKYCKNCYLSAICPPLSTYERQGLLKKACKYSNIPILR